MALPLIEALPETTASTIRLIMVATLTVIDLTCGPRRLKEEPRRGRPVRRLPRRMLPIGDVWQHAGVGLNTLGENLALDHVR